MPMSNVIKKTAVLKSAKSEKTDSSVKSANEIDDIFASPPKPTMKTSSKAPSKASFKRSAESVSGFDDSLPPPPQQQQQPAKKRSKTSEQKAKAEHENGDGFFDSRGQSGRRRVDGVLVYSVDELNIGHGKDTDQCPFDCDCCF
eukprot:ANDGO_05282.mRNA.1 Uncharacterized protein C6G9.01c